MSDPSTAAKESTISAVFDELDSNRVLPVISTHALKKTPDMTLTLRSLHNNNDFSEFEITKVKVLWGESDGLTQHLHKESAGKAFLGTQWTRP